MATILLVAHEDDLFSSSHYLVRGLFPYWIEAGHEVLVREGTADLPRADVAILHVDLTVVPLAYLEALRGFPAVINGATGDVSKRSFSQHLVVPGDGYGGPVIVKTDLNCGGQPEAFQAQVALRKGRKLAPPVRFMRGRYPVFDSPAQVPAGVWRDPDLVVEKFLPERDERG